MPDIVGCRTSRKGEFKKTAITRTGKCTLDRGVVSCRLTLPDSRTVCDASTNGPGWEGGPTRDISFFIDYSDGSRKDGDPGTPSVARADADALVKSLYEDNLGTFRSAANTIIELLSDKSVTEKVLTAEKEILDKYISQEYKDFKSREMGDSEFSKLYSESADRAREITKEAFENAGNRWGNLKEQSLNVRSAIEKTVDDAWQQAKDGISNVMGRK